MADKFLRVHPTLGVPSELEATTSSTGVANAGNIVALDSTGKLDISLMPAGLSGEISGQIGFGVSNSGASITDGVKRVIRITEDTQITGWVLSADVAGDAVIDLWASSGYPPTISDSITGATPPTLTAQTDAAGLVADWITTIPADTWLAFVVNEGATVSRLDLTLKTTRDT